MFQEYIGAQAIYIYSSESYYHAVRSILENINHYANEDPHGLPAAVDRIKKAFLDKWEWMRPDYQDPSLSSFFEQDDTKRLAGSPPQETRPVYKTNLTNRHELEFNVLGKGITFYSNYQTIYGLKEK